MLMDIETSLLSADFSYLTEPDKDVFFDNLEPDNVIKLIRTIYVRVVDKIRDVDVNDTNINTLNKVRSELELLQTLFQLKKLAKLHDDGSGNSIDDKALDELTSTVNQIVERIETIEIGSSNVEFLDEDEIDDVLFNVFN